MRINEARKHPLPGEVHAPRFLARERQDLTIRPHRQEAAIANRYRRDPGVSRLHGMNQPVVQDQIGIGAGEPQQRQRRQGLDHVAACGAHSLVSSTSSHRGCVNAT